MESMEDIFAGLNDYLDILDEAGNKTGEIKTYDEVHAKGLLHKSVHIWAVNSKGEVLLQKRSKFVRAYSECWDNSAAGHVTSQQSSIEAAQAETKEELGLDLLPDDFEYLFTLRQNIVSNNGTYLENEFVDIYLIRLDFEISKYKGEPDEVEELRWLTKEEFKKWIQGEGEQMVPHREEYEKILEYLN